MSAAMTWCSLPFSLSPSLFSLLFFHLPFSLSFAPLHGRLPHVPSGTAIMRSSRLMPRPLLACLFCLFILRFNPGTLSTSTVRSPGFVSSSFPLCLFNGDMHVYDYSP